MGANGEQVRIAIDVSEKKYFGEKYFGQVGDESMRLYVGTLVLPANMTDNSMTFPLPLRHGTIVRVMAIRETVCDSCGKPL